MVGPRGTAGLRGLAGPFGLTVAPCPGLLSHPGLEIACAMSGKARGQALGAGHGSQPSSVTRSLDMKALKAGQMSSRRSISTDWKFSAASFLKRSSIELS